MRILLMTMLGLLIAAFAAMPASAEWRPVTGAESAQALRSAFPENISYETRLLNGRGMQFTFGRGTGVAKIEGAPRPVVISWSGYGGGNGAFVTLQFIDDGGTPNNLSDDSSQFSEQLRLVIKSGARCCGQQNGRALFGLSGKRGVISLVFKGGGDAFGLLTARLGAPALGIIEAQQACLDNPKLRRAKWKELFDRGEWDCGERRRTVAMCDRDPSACTTVGGLIGQAATDMVQGWRRLSPEKKSAIARKVGQCITNRKSCESQCESLSNTGCTNLSSCIWSTGSPRTKCRSACYQKFGC